MKELFLCHHSSRAAEIADLATYLRMRGLTPWADKGRGGFKIGDDSGEEACRVIQEDCFGLLFYATAPAFKSSFIRTYEMATAREVKEADPQFVLSSFVRGMTFRRLSKLSRENFGFDLSRYHSVVVDRAHSQGALEQGWRKVSCEALRAFLDPLETTDFVSLQYSTRQLFDDGTEDTLRIDATPYLADDLVNNSAWDELRRSLADVETEIAYKFGRPEILVHGSKHLTAAFMFGRIFQRYRLSIRQTPADVWRSYIPGSSIKPFHAERLVPPQHDGSLFVEIASGNKNLRPGVDQTIGDLDSCPARLRLMPQNGPLDVDNTLCVAMANQAYCEIESSLSDASCQSLHLFVAAPQAFVMMLAQRFAGLPEVHFYEWDNGQYVKTCVVRGGAAGAT